MKKIFMLAVVFILGIFTLASCDDTEVDTDGDKNQTTGEFVESDITQGNKNYIVSLSVDTSQAKVDYYLTEEFDSNNVKVTANYRDSSSADITSKVTFDSSSFNNQKEGVYNIGVSYIDDEQQLYASYNVTVDNILSLLTEPYIVGLNLDLSTIKTDYQHDEEIEDYSNLKATLVLSNGTEQTITKEDTNLSIDTSNIDMSKAGFYDVLISYSKTYTTTEGFSQTLVVSNYYKLQVIDPVTTLTFVSGNTVVDQYQTLDTSDWILEVTYESGSTLEISGTQVKVVLDSSVAGVGKAIVSYTEYGVTVSCEVEITVNEVELQKYSINFDDSIGESFSKETTFFEDDYITLYNGIGVSDKTGSINVMGLSTPASTNDGKSFISALMHTGGKRSIIITAKSNIVVTIYYNVGNDSFNTPAPELKANKLTFKDVTTQETITVGDGAKNNNNVAISYTFSMAAGQSYEMYDAGNRIVLFGLDISVAA